MEELGNTDFNEGQEVKVCKKFRGNVVNGWRPDHKPGSKNVCAAAQSGERSIFSFEEADLLCSAGSLMQQHFLRIEHHTCGHRAYRDFCV